MREHREPPHTVAAWRRDGRERERERERDEREREKLSGEREASGEEERKIDGTAAHGGGKRGSDDTVGSDRPIFREDKRNGVCR
ncbi:hypothetical protein Hanom_Chr07g00600271 [Helianthus anomalus]